VIIEYHSISSNYVGWVVRVSVAEQSEQNPRFFLLLLGFTSFYPTYKLKICCRVLYYCINPANKQIVDI
ncbi:MAG: hypothetical protein ACK55G_04510, partial [Dolichospermum sp.]